MSFTTQSSEQTRAKNPVGLAAAIVAGVAVLFAIIPVMSFVAWLPAIAAIVLGIVGLALKGRKRGLALAGLIGGAAAWVIAIIVSVASVAGLAGAVNEEIENQQASTAPAAPATPSAEASAPEESAAPTEEAADAPDVPVEYASALTKAQMYSDVMQMSKAGIYNQLTSEYGEKFSPEAAQYAVDTLQADYNANALAKAKQYQDTMAMSPSAIHDQLTSEYGERFTAEEADYAIANLNN